MASIEALRARQEGDEVRHRRSFENHLHFIGPQIRYFEALHSFSTEQVRFVDASTTEATVGAVSQAVPLAPAQQRPMEIFDFLIHWLCEHRAAQEDH